jgi:hypothetical protein
MFFQDWKCAEAKAKLYVDLINMPTCMKDIMSTHPTYYDYFKYCNALLTRSALALLAVSSLLLLHF